MADGMPAPIDRAALDDFTVLGLTTNLPLLRAIVAHPAYLAGDTHTAFLAEHQLDAGFYDLLDSLRATTT